MGLQATVVHDTVRHTPLVVRSASFGASSTAALADTIASFSEHASSHRLETPTEICARWGGPPYITYSLVKRRFRAMVVWDEEPGEIDVAHDVHVCMTVLQRAVLKHAAALAGDDDDGAALAAVYAAAGRALRRGGDAAAEPKTIEIKEPKRAGFLTFLGRGKRGSETKVKQVVTTKTTNNVIDDKPSNLTLPNEVFNWADFGGALPPSGGDIEWLADLLRGDEHRVSILPPVLQDEKAKVENITGAVAAMPPPPIELSAPAVPVSTPSLSDPLSPPLSVVSPKSTSVDSAPPIAARSAPQAPVQHTVPVIVPAPAPTAVREAAPTPIVLAPTPSHSLPPRPPQEPTIAASQPAAATIHATAAQNAPVGGAASNAAFNTTIPAAAPRAPQAPSGVRGRGDAGDDFDLNALGGYKDAATSSSSVTPEARNDPIRGMMNTFAKSMQSGHFEAALQQVSATLRVLASQTPRRTRETATCAHYVLSLKIILRVRTLTTPAGALQAALLTMFMAELRHLLPTHRQAAMRMAIEKNIAVGNFGMAARWIRQVATTPEAKKALANNLLLCRQHGESNAHMPPTNKLCYNLLVVLAAPYGSCTNCPAVFRPGISGVNISQKCPICFVGIVAVAQ